MIETYVCHYQWGDGTRTVRHVNFQYFTGGFWLGANHEVPSCLETVYWIPESRILFVEAVRSE